MALLLCLSATLLPLLFAVSPASAQALQWPYNLPEGVMYYPEDEPLVKRGLEAIKRLETQKPVAVKKMSPDPNEMFFLDYWIFENDAESQPDRLEARSESISATNQSAQVPIAPVRPLLYDEFKVRRDWIDPLGYSPLMKRLFQCPTGYTNCSMVGQPNLCCATGSTCFKNGAGTVGCCPDEATCGDGTVIGTCNTDEGFTPCPNTSNGGCCIKDFTCFDEGCISVSISTTTTTVVPTATCSPSYNNCPGGGCCPASMACASGTCLASTTSTSVVGVAPVVATGTTATLTAAASSTTDTSAEAVPAGIVVTSSSSYWYCPTNYYFCSAYYRPGCCQIDRQCGMTDCPAAVSSSTFISHGVTIVVPEGTSTGGTSYQSEVLITTTLPAFGLGNCASDWPTCSQSLGGGCCPTGFDCGTASCVMGTSVVGKEAPNGATNSRMADGMGLIFMGLGLVVGAGMILL